MKERHLARETGGGTLIQRRGLNCQLDFWDADSEVKISKHGVAENGPQEGVAWRQPVGKGTGGGAAGLSAVAVMFQ